MTLEAPENALNANSTTEKSHEAFESLRETIHNETERETELRITKNKAPTNEEVLIGAYIETLEPQVRNAVFEMYRKGYATESSGFGGKFGEFQQIDGFFTIDEETKRKLQAIGVEVLKDDDVGMNHGKADYTYISFKPETPDIEKIKQKWDQIVSILPDLNIPAEPSIFSEEFQGEMTPQQKEIKRARIKRRLALIDVSPETKQELQKQLDELT